jgi:hypothetical protein
MQNNKWQNIADGRNKATEFIEEMLVKLGVPHPECGICVGPGWVPPLEEALTKMVSSGWDKNLSQIKQKFCGLRIYIGQENKAIRAAIAKAEEDCARLCEHCGLEREEKGDGFGLALCNACRTGVWHA